MLTMFNLYFEVQVTFIIRLSAMPPDFLAVNSANYYIILN